MSKKSFYKQTAKVDIASISTVLEVDKPTKFVHSSEAKRSSKRVSSVWGKWIAGSLVVVLILGCGWIGIVGTWYWKTFEQSAHMSLSTLVKDVWIHRATTLIPNGGYKTFLLLGVDQSVNQRETSLLTDTMIFAGIHSDGSVKLISLPRDLWIESLQTKVNALYYYGQQMNPDDGVTLVSSVVTEMSGIPVDYTFLINMDTLKQVIDAIGGVDVVVARSFTDSEYPREVDLASKKR